MTKLLIAAAFLAANSYVYYGLARNPVIPARETFAAFPLQLDQWRCGEKAVLEPEILRNLGATDYLICEYHRDAGERVEVYVGYHASQVREEGGGAGENSIHPPAHCLPGSGWDIISNETVALDVNGLPGEEPRIKRLVIAKGEARQLVYYWYQSRGRVIAEDWKKILYVGWDRATVGRTDGALIRFTTPIVRGDEERADEMLHELAPLVLRDLDRYVPI